MIEREEIEKERYGDTEEAQGVMEGVTKSQLACDKSSSEERKHWQLNAWQCIKKMENDMVNAYVLSEEELQLELS